MLKKFLALVMCIVLMCGMGVVANAQGVSSADDYTVLVKSTNTNS